MGNLKTCDIHPKPFPDNLIDVDKTKMYKLYIEQRVQDPKDAKKQINATLFVGSSTAEGIDVCHKCMMETILPRVQALADVSWKSVKWQNTKDDNGKEHLNKEIKEIA